MANYVDIRDRGSVVAGAFWMFVVSLLLFWLPAVGPLVAGIVGGKRAGGVGPGILAAFLPALAVAVFVMVLCTAVGLPVVGVLSGTVAFIAVAGVVVGPLLLGAILGGVMA
jgi:hypothetical protein